MTTCAVMLTLGWDRVTTRYGQWSAQCARSSGFTSLDVSALVRALPRTRTPMRRHRGRSRRLRRPFSSHHRPGVDPNAVSRRFRAAPASILAVVLGEVGVGDALATRVSRPRRRILTSGVSSGVSTSPSPPVSPFPLHTLPTHSPRARISNGRITSASASAFRASSPPPRTAASARDLVSTLLAGFPSTSPSSSDTY